MKFFLLFILLTSFGKTAVLCNGVGSLIVSFAPPFFAVVIGLIFLGIGAGINDATTSTYMACYSSEVMLSLLYAFLGVSTTSGF